MDGRVTRRTWLLAWAAAAALLPASVPALGAAPQEAARPATPASSPPVGPPAQVPAAPLAPQAPPILHAGTALTLRIRQVLPSDGFSQGERMLSGQPAIQPGDHFLAEIIKLPSTPPPLVAGTIVAVSRPRKFGRPGRITLQVAQLVETPDGTSQPVPWQFDTEDRSFAARRQRAILTALLALEGAGFGAALGSQWSTTLPKIPIAVGAGAGAGMVLGLGYASLRRGAEASLEPGDCFEVVVGTTSYRPVPREAFLKIYPAPEPPHGDGKHKP